MKLPFDDFIHLFTLPEWVGKACLDGAISFDEGTRLAVFLVGYSDMPGRIITVPAEFDGMMKVIHFWNDVHSEILH